MQEKARLARELMARIGYGVLATLSVRHPGWPFASAIPYSLDAAGAMPEFLLSGLAVHTKNLREDARVSLLVMEAPGEGSPLETARVTLMGEMREIEDEAEAAAMRERFVARHPDSAAWSQFGDFRPFRLDVKDVYYIGGFGAMGWVSGASYRE